MKMKHLMKQKFSYMQEKSSQEAFTRRLSSQIKANNRAGICALLGSSLSASTDSLPSSLSPFNPPAAFSHSNSSTPSDSCLSQTSLIRSKIDRSSKVIYPNVMCSSLPTISSPSAESCDHLAPCKSLMSPTYSPDERVRAERGRGRDLFKGSIKRKLSASIPSPISSNPSSCRDTLPKSMASIGGPPPYGGVMFHIPPRIDITKRTSDSDTDTDINHRWALAIDQKSLKWYYYNRS